MKEKKAKTLNVSLQVVDKPEAGMDNSAKPATKEHFESGVGRMKICPFMSQGSPKSYCIAQECMAWQCLGDFKEKVEGELRLVRKWGCLLIHKGE